MAQHWDRDPKTGDYVMTGGAPKQTDSLKIPAYLRLKSPRRGWLYAPDDRWGSDFHALLKNRATTDPGIYENLATRALSPMVEDGRVESATAEVVARDRYGVEIKSTLVSSSGKQEEITFDPIGV